MGNTRIIDYLQNKGLIDQYKADQLRVELSKSSKTEEQLLLESSAVDEITIAQAKSSIFNIPFIDIQTVSVPDALLSSINGDLLRKFKAVPFEQVGSVVKVAMVDPFDIQAIQSLERKFALGTKLSVYIATDSAMQTVLDRKIGEAITGEVSKALEDVEEHTTDLEDDAMSLESTDLQNAPVARIVNSIFQFGVKQNASDIHIEPMESKLRVRFRIHGILTEKLSLPKHLTSAVISRLKIMASLKIDEKRIPQDGRIPLKTADRKIDVRVSTLPTVYGEKVVMRLLESGVSVPALESSGLRGGGYKVYLDSIKSTNGIILITGPTGSGKTRTLASTLGKVNDPKVNIVTLENPVEIRVPGVNQVQINPDAGLTFAAGLRAILRQDPNIVMVGEIRDEETAQLAVEASLTGHLVLSTLHTNSAAAAIPRLLDMGIEPYLLASTLRLVVAQRLPRKICEYCRQAYPATPEQLQQLNEGLGSIQGFDLIKYVTETAKMMSLNKLQKVDGTLQAEIKVPETGPDGAPIVYLYKGTGCDRCNGSGYQGRIGIFEVLQVNEKMGRMMIDSRPASEVQEEAVKNGMVLMKQDGYLKALEGVTTIEEVLRVSKD